MKLLFKKLSETLTKELSKVKAIDLWNNQVENIAIEQAIDFDKSIFIELQFENMQSTGNNVQHGDGLIVIHITQITFTDSQFSLKDDAGYNPLKVLDYVDEVHSVLEGLSIIDDDGNKLATSLQRATIVQDTNHTALHHHIMAYHTQLIDYTAQRTRDYIPVPDVVPVVTHENPLVRA